VILLGHLGNDACMFFWVIKSQLAPSEICKKIQARNFAAGNFNAWFMSLVKLSKLHKLLLKCEVVLKKKCRWNSWWNGARQRKMKVKDVVQDKRIRECNRNLLDFSSLETICEHIKFCLPMNFWICDGSHCDDDEIYDESSKFLLEYTPKTLNRICQKIARHRLTLIWSSLLKIHPDLL
jgi:hypothetical protein